jgi:multidrug efflux pump subunit AcrA (membrane-fusion protein)
MSQGAVDAATIEQTKQQIRGLVQQIAQLSRSEIEPEEFYAEVLQRIVSALAAVGGAVWTITGDKRLKLDYQINISRHLLDVETDDAQRHLRLLQQVIVSGEPKLVPPQSGSAEAGSPGNPTNALLVLAPMQTADSVEGVLEIFQRPDSQPASQQGYLKFLVQMSQLVGDWLKSRKLRHYSSRQALWAQIDRFAKEVHNSLDVRETAYTIANEGRRLIGCDRLSVAIRTGVKNQIEAVSGQDTLDTRSNIVSLLRQLTDRVCATGEPLWYTGVAEDLPPQIEKALQEYIDESHSKAIAVLPIRHRDTEVKPDDLGVDESDSDESTGEVLGALIVEQIDSTQSRDLLAPRVELVCHHSERALGNALEHNSLFLMPLWRSLGRAKLLVQARTLPKTLFFSILALAAIITLVAVPIDFKLKARGTLEPVRRSDVFFAVDGLVQQLEVDHGSQVNQGDLLVVLRNEELNQRLIEITGKYQAAVAREKDLESTRLRTTGQDRARTQTELHQIRQDILSYERQLQSLRDQVDHLQVRSPLNGEVVTWDLEHLLPAGRPVMAGQRALEVADTSKDAEWELITFLPEKQMGHFLREHLSQAGDAEVVDVAARDIKVTYILLNEPDRRLTGRLLEVQRSAQLHEEDGVSYRLRIGVQKSDLSKPRPGAEVIARVYCGRRPVGYVWFYPAVQWVQTHLFF